MVGLLEEHQNREDGRWWWRRIGVTAPWEWMMITKDRQKVIVLVEEKPNISRNLLTIIAVWYKTWLAVQTKLNNAAAHGAGFVIQMSPGPNAP